MVACSVSGDMDGSEEVRKLLLNAFKANFSKCMIMIVDIDSIQAHGTFLLLRYCCRLLTCTGVAASDIAKLKSNGIHTVTVSNSFSYYTLQTLMFKF